MPAGSTLHVHLPLGEPVQAIGGSYVLVKEALLPFHGGEVLYVVGHAAFDSSCCGAGGCAYARVAGLVLAWHAGHDDGGRPLTEVLPIADEDDRDTLTREIHRREAVGQVLFEEA